MEVLTLLALLGAAVAQYPAEDPTFDIFTERRYLTRKKYRPLYHITCPMGWLNDPAGFVKFRQQYHIFYQYHPYNGAWGHMNWGHAVSDNLVDWTYYPPALVPKEYYEKHGCLAGSALVHNDYLTLFYTGNVVINNKTHQNQNVAISSDGIVFQKYLYNPIIKASPYGNDGEFRNPKVWRFRNSWYMLVGVMSRQQQGQLLLYSSPDMFHWKLNGTVAQSYGDMGYVWENPEFFEIDGQHVLIFCARGVQTDGYRFRNLYQTGYLVGTFDYLSGQFDDEFEVSTATFNELDYGHDFYAPQTLLDDDGRRLLVGWLGMWESSFEESKEGWASMLTLTRELKLSSRGHLLMTPVIEAMELRSEILEDAWYSPGEAFYAGSKAFELIVNSTAGANDASIIFEWNGERRYVVEYSAKRGYVSVNRGGEDGMRRADWAPPSDLVHWRIYVDFSSIEVFCGGGEVVFSSRIYPRRAIRVRIGGDTQLHVVQYRLRRSISYDTRIRKNLPFPSVIQPHQVQDMGGLNRKKRFRNTRSHKTTRTDATTEKAPMSFSLV
ncbi:sucrose-6-phosphate hydrolase-like [Pectinophora gossypiella]|uniref:sucrose-6-phosphate hydrolase-like n=1 Tax=Pectinophora gossypiella TaxID=13191 RepID=UPI00214F0489|nr:sucrose-6-phosphate hydrolase-like [Pectinophora gossypiella]